jgi:urocanate hydratase
MGGAQPLAVTMNEGVGLIVEVDRGAPKRRLELRQVDRHDDDLEEAMTWVEEALRRKAANRWPGRQCRRSPAGTGRARGRARTSSPTRPRRMIRCTAISRRPDPGSTPRAARSDPQAIRQRAMASHGAHVQAMLDWQAKRGAVVFDYGNNLRQRAFDNGVKDAFDYPGFVPAYIRPLVLRGQRPLSAGSRCPAIRRTSTHRRPHHLELFPEDEHLRALDQMARSAIPSRGCPRASAGWAMASAPVPG